MNAACRRLSLTVLAVAVALVSGRTRAADPDLAWPPVTRECRPWSSWWWPGSAVDSTNLTRELQRYRAAGWGGVHIIPIYGAKGWEDRYLDYLSPQWLAMLPRSMYHDSYEYNSNWSPDLFAQFAQRRGYRLEAELPALLRQTGYDRAARVRCDYRETLSDLLIEETLPLWVKWCHDRGLRTRNQAHGSPGNLLDLYALADIPETEMLHSDRNRLVSKFASSAAHVAGRRLVAAETGTWLQEHFTETLADLKFLLDDLFLSGVNHAIYHGTCYSPDEAPWPGWLFYASYEMNPRNSVWRDVPALNEYVARCQSVLQTGAADHDLLLYWPLYDFWQQPAGLEQKLTVHARGWFENQAVGQAAERLWRRGYAFDYVSDRPLALAESAPPDLRVPGGAYRAVVVPRCNMMSVGTPLTHAHGVKH